MSYHHQVAQLQLAVEEVQPLGPHLSSPTQEDRTQRSRTSQCLSSPSAHRRQDCTGAPQLLRREHESKPRVWEGVSSVSNQPIFFLVLRGLVLGPSCYPVPLLDHPGFRALILSSIFPGYFPPLYGGHLAFTARASAGEFPRTAYSSPSKLWKELAVPWGDWKGVFPAQSEISDPLVQDVAFPGVSGSCSFRT